MHPTLSKIANELKFGLRTDRMSAQVGNMFGDCTGKPFSCRESSMWNGLAGKFSQAETLKSFKKQLDSIMWGTEYLTENAP